MQTQNLFWKMRRTTPQGFCDTSGSPNIGQTTRHSNNQQIKIEPLEL